MSSLVGQTISHYRILEQIGSGGMGVVYRAEDTRLHRTVAVKFLHTGILPDQAEQKRFEHEAGAAAQLAHPNIATIYDYEEQVDPHTATRSAFIAMEFVDGETLARRIDRGPIPVRDLLSIARQVASALQAAHAKRIVHRDVKPSNIIVRDDGSVKILDFGIARRAGETRVTVAGHVVGSIAYMSPEQLRGEDAGSSSDIWSFGALLYEMLTGRPPFRGEHPASLVYAIMSEEPASPGRPELPPGIEEICMRCLRKKAEDRPGSMSEVLAALGAQEAAAGPAHPPAATRRYMRAGLAAVSVAAVAAAAILATPSLRSRISSLWSPGHRILVVIPFTAVDSTAESGRYSAGLSWFVPSRLAGLLRGNKTISLVGSRDVSTYRVTNSTEARKILGASLVVTGALQRAGGSYRLTVDLVDPATNRQIDSRFATYGPDSYAAMEDDAIRDVVAMLGLGTQQAGSDVALRGTADDEAYQFYAQGEGYLAQYQKKSNLLIAAGLFSRAIMKDSAYAAAHAGLAETCWRLYEATSDTTWIPTAAAEARKATALRHDLPEALVATGLISSGTGRYEEAASEFQKAVALEPENTEALRGLAGACTLLGNFAKAESTYKQAIQIDPPYWAGYSYLGYFYYTRGRYEDAAAQFLKVTALTPDNVRGYNNLGAMYIYLQKWKEASEALEKAVALEPGADTYSLLGNTYFYRGDYGGAARAYEAALRIDSSDYRIWGNLAGAQYWTPGDREKSAGTFRRAVASAETRLRVDPRDAMAASHLASFYAFLGEKEKARPFLEQSLRDSTASPEILERAAETYLALGERSLGAKCLGDALKSGFEPGLLALNPAVRELMSDANIRDLIEKRTAGQTH